jgi:hypothetical protein
VADNALRLAQAERERRRRLAERQLARQQQAAKPPASGMREQIGELTAGIARPLAGVVDFAMSPVAAGFEAVTGEPARGLSTNIPQAGAYTGERGMAAAAGEYMGMALPIAMGLPAIGSTVPRMGQGVVQTFLDSITRTAMAQPKTYMAGEMASAAGAGMAGEAARQGGAGPVGQIGSEFAGSMAGGLPTMIPAGFRAGREAVLANLAPMTTEGGMIRAARQTQQRAGGAERASAMAADLDAIPSGVTPAQWIGDERLMSQEARLLADNAELSGQVKSELQEARLAAQDALRDSMGRPRTRQDWEKSVLERVAPEGTVIQPGMSDEMLEQAYSAFRPMYDAAKGYDIAVPSFNTALRRTSRDPEVIATDAERRAVEGWLNNQYTALKVTGDNVPSDRLLDLRSRIRDERRGQSKRGNMERSDLLGSAEALITQTLENQLPDEVRATIRAADSQYRKYKVVENAIFNAGDIPLSADQLSQAIRTSGLTTPSRYARGADPVVQELRIAAMGGRSTEEVLGDPRRAAMFVRGLDDEGKRAVQADFVNTLYNRAKERAVSATEGGAPLISGQQLIKDIAENRQVMARLGMSQGDISRVENMAREIVRMERRPPAAVNQLFEDGPASLLQLGAALLGAKSGQRMAGRGMGSSLVLAQFMSNRARKILANLTSDEAERLMMDAATDPKLYKALLTKELIEPNRERQSAQYLESWLLASAYNQSQEQR